MIPGHVENASDVPWELLRRHGVFGRLPAPGTYLEAIVRDFRILIFMPTFVIIVSLLSTIFMDSLDFEPQDDRRDEA